MSAGIPRLYSVSYTNGPNDNGHCVTFCTLAEAEAARRELMRDGCQPGPVCESWQDTGEVYED
jgi:hypothetical protein